MVKITEYTIQEFKGMHEGTDIPYHYFILKLDDGLYYAGYPTEGRKVIRTTNDIGYAERFKKKEFVEDMINFLKKGFDEEGRILET